MGSAGSQQWELGKFPSSRFPGQMAGAVPTAWPPQHGMGLPGRGGEGLVPGRGLRTAALSFEVARAPQVRYPECLGREAPADAQLCDARLKVLLLFRVASLASVPGSTEACIRCHGHGLVAGVGGGLIHHPQPESSRWTCRSRLPARPEQALLVCRINYEILRIFLQRHLVLLIRNP